MTRASAVAASVVTVVVALGAAGAAIGADEPKQPIQGTNVKEGATVTDAKKERILKDIKQYATPDLHHQRLEALVGKFDTKAKLWFGDPKPETASGRAEIQSLLGGRFIEEHYDSIIWGKPFSAQGTLGYDQLVEKYVISWIDNWGSWITVAEGDASPDGKTITLTTRNYDNPTGKSRPIKFVLAIDNPEHHWRRVYEKVQGKETMTMEIEYRKKK
jgi:hypothetical protein